jgi:site-specific DNA recombinase
MGTPATGPEFQVAQAGAATAGPAEPVPVAILARTSTLLLQDPLASLRRQIRSCTEWLPDGWRITACYWDVESGGIDLDQRGHGETWRPFADAGIPRDGGIADLIHAAKAPAPPFAAVVCEDIERSARDMFSALKLEKELDAQGIPLFATDEPAQIEGINATSVLVRRIKQGIAEWYRIQLKDKVWKGLKEHSLEGWNLGPVPYGYAGDRVPHPIPAKAAEGRTKTRLAPDPVRGPIVTLIYQWRVTDHLGTPTIAARLNADPDRYPAPSPETGWTAITVARILANPKYTGYMVLGRTRRQKNRARPMPPDQWIWSAQPTHEPLVDKPTWDAAQRAAADHGTSRDTETPTSRPGRRYQLRSRLWCKICRRRMRGVTRTGPTRATYTYYRCPHDKSIPRHAAAHPGHPSVTVREDDLIAALARFFTERVFGPDRAAMLAAALPASAADQATQRTAKATALRRQLARIDTAENALITELEAPAQPGDPAAQALRNRIRARFTDLFTERTRLETELAALQAATTQDNDPALLDALPILGDILTGAPARLIEQLLDAFNVQAVYSNDLHQVTIHATVTDATPHAITGLLNDPRTGHATPAQTSVPATQDHLSHLAADTGT